MDSTQSDNLHVQIVHHGTTRVIHAPKAANVDRLFTGGDDRLVRILPSLPLPNVEPLLIEDATEAVTWIDTDEKYLVTASEDGSVRMYKHHPLDLDGKPTSPTVLQGLLRRESLPVRCVALERALKSGKTPRVAVCSDELIVKIIDVADPRRIQLLDGHSRGLRSAAWSPVAPILVTCSTDGVARVNDLGDVEPKLIRSIEGILPITRPESEEAALACWHPSGTFFVLPSKAHELVVISATNDSSAWQRVGAFVSNAAASIRAPSGSATALAFCPNGRYLAVATTDGQVTVWETETRQAIRARRADSLVTAISWSPNKDALAWTDNEGSLARWSDVLGSTHPSPCEYISFDSRKAARGSRSNIDDIFEGTGLSDDEDDAVDNRGAETDALDDFVVDDEGGRGAYGSRSAHGRGGSRAGGRARDPADSMLVASTRPQAAFQPTSTPMKGQRRYLAYNLLGSITAVEQDSHQTISFESFDTSARRNFRFSDMNSLSMASLAKQGILFAGKESGEHASSVYYKPFTPGSAASSLASEWTLNLALGEDIDAVALGGSGLRTASQDEDDEWAADDDSANAAQGMAVIATSKGYLRFLSTSGMQVYLWALGHPVITMAAGARALLVIHRTAGAPSGGFQDLGYKLIDLSSFDVIQDDAIPLSKDTHLRWVGFNDQQQPAFYDSNGSLFVLDRAHRCRQGRWVPSLDTKAATPAMGDAGISEAAIKAASKMDYWPVALTSRKLMVLMLKGGRSHPEVDGTRHLLQELELQLPLIHREGGTGPLEEKSLRDGMLATAVRDVKCAGLSSSVEAAGAGAGAGAGTGDDRLDATSLEMSADKSLLQLIQLACKADKHGRALDAARALHSTRTLEAALKIAAFFHLSSLAERMVALKGALADRPTKVELESRRWCDPAARGGPVYTYPALVDFAARSNPAGSGSNALAAAARKRASAALASDFRPSNGAGSVLGGLLSSSSSSSSSPSSALRDSAVPAVAMSSPAYAMHNESFVSDPDSFTNESSVGTGKENLFRDASMSGSAGEKRKSYPLAEEDAVPLQLAHQPPPPKQHRSNPFARTSSNLPSNSSSNQQRTASGDKSSRERDRDRDREMHKSTSFFERIEPFEASSSSGVAGAARSVGAKQSRLTGFAFKPKTAPVAAAVHVESVPTDVDAPHPEAELENALHHNNNDDDMSVEDPTAKFSQRLDADPTVQFST
ncbi:hypothetical protein BCV70DRAFT_197849 [Testicularia cyperi]|uniref:Uncharacterized protein n=1 Tax=Testicularia cyperi TaxID=1882483 RepID=A0A317Y0D1_9BASI|nr:hypothetical protein BCV70DRAFT_197849 [Testicularia cyperi]